MSITEQNPPSPNQHLLAPWVVYMLRAVTRGPKLTSPPAAPADWAALIQAANFHHLGPLLYWALHQAPPDTQPPAAFMQQLHRHYVTTTIQSLMHKQELQKALQALQHVGVRPTLYKGAALAHTVYPVPSCRPMGDLDLWVTAEEMPVAQQALEALGYREKSSASRPLALQQQQDGELQLVGEPPQQGLIELHWGVFSGQWLQQVTQIDRVGVTQRRVATELLKTPVYLLEPEDAIIQLAVHVAINHQLSRHPLRSLFDIALLDQQPADWSVITERVRQWQLATMMSVVLDLLVAIFGSATVSPGLCQAAQALRPSPWRKQLTARWRAPEPIFAERQIRASSERFLYLLGMVDRPQDQVALLFRTIWPAQQWLEARYGTASGLTRLRHLRSTLRGEI